jgi:hypothetical protein
MVRNARAQLGLRAPFGLNFQQKSISEGALDLCNQKGRIRLSCIIRGPKIIHFTLCPSSFKGLYDETSRSSTPCVWPQGLDVIANCKWEYAIGQWT